MKSVFVVVYKTQTMGEAGDRTFDDYHVNMKGFADIDDCRRWCVRNGAKPIDGSNESMYYWVDELPRGGRRNNWYIINEIDVAGL